jgi:16S rRNA processing protein RimM
MTAPGKEGPGGDRWVVVARNAALRGARGILTARLVAPGANPFRPGQHLGFRRAGEQRELVLLSAESYRDRVVLKLQGVESAREATELVGADILLKSGDLVDLPEGTYYIFRLVGLEVRLPDGRPVGRVLEVLRTGGTDLLVIGGEAGRDLLIPFAHSICRRVDLDAGRIEIDPPEGLLELDAV